MRKTNSDLPNTGAALVNSDMYTADQTLTAGQTFTTASSAIKTAGADEVDLYFKFTANASSGGGTVTFSIACSPDGSTFDTIGTPFAGAINTTTPYTTLFLGKIASKNLVAIKVIKIVNGDASYGLTAVNVHAYALQ